MLEWHSCFLVFVEWRSSSNSVRFSHRRSLWYQNKVGKDLDLKGAQWSFYSGNTSGTRKSVLCIEVTLQLRKPTQRFLGRHFFQSAVLWKRHLCVVLEPNHSKTMRGLVVYVKFKLDVLSNRRFLWTAPWWLRASYLRKKKQCICSKQAPYKEFSRFIADPKTLLKFKFVLILGP